MAYENFLADYTKLDPNEKITLSSTKTAFDDITDGDDTYVYRDKGVDFFSGAYIFQLEIEYTSGTNTPAAFWALSNILNDLKYIKDIDDYAEYLYRGVTNSLILARINNGVVQSDVWTGWTTGVTYYVTIERTVGGVLTAEIRTGSHTGELQDTLQVTSATTAYRYIFSYNHLRTVSGNYCYGFTQNLDLGGIEPVLLAGIADCTSAAVGTLKVTKGLAGTAVITSTTSGTLSKLKLLAGTATIQSTTQGVIKVKSKLKGTAIIQSTTQGVIKVESKLKGSAAIQCTTNGVIKRIRTLAGNAVITCTTSGNLTKVGLLPPSHRKRAKYECPIAA